MARTKQQITENAATDDQGGEHTLYQVATYDELLVYGGSRWAERVKELYLDRIDPEVGGAMLNRVQKGVYVTVVGGLRVTSDDPNAP